VSAISERATKLNLGDMNRASKFRVVFLSVLLLVAAIIVIAREHRPSFLRSGLRLYAYVSTADNSVSVVDLVKLATVAHVPVGGTISAMREHPSRAELWGVSASGGFAWVLDSRTSQIVARIPVGPLPYSIDFSADGNRAYVPASGSNSLVAIDCGSRQVIAHAGTGAQPVVARVSEDDRFVVVLNRKDSTAGIYDAATLRLRFTVGVVPDPEDAVILRDHSIAFIRSSTQKRLSVIDLEKGQLLTNLEMAGIPSQMILKPDGGELYVLSPESHGLQAINTWTHEVGDYVVLGSAPTRGVLLADTGELYVSDAAAGSVTPVDISYRRLGRPIAAGQSPGALRFDPGDKARLLLVVSQASGGLSVIRIAADRTNDLKSSPPCCLLTIIPVGEQPRELAVKLF
jgi:YVTN family beta-propeller protein